MKVLAGDVKIYTVNGVVNKSLPEWLAKNRRKLKHSHEYRQQVDLIQDFEFPETSICIKTTRDGNYAMATGTYKPHIRVFDFAEMSIKFERHCMSENITFEILSDDWTKSVHLQSDRSIEFHAQGGVHYTTRIPNYGRDLAYHYPSCTLYIASSSHELYRLNLELGQFVDSIIVDSIIESMTKLSFNPAHQLLGCGTDSGTIEFFDPRTFGRVGILDSTLGVDNNNSISAFAFHEAGLNMAVGTASGYTILYDLRSPRSLLKKDQGYGNPIKSLRFLDGQDYLLSADSKIIKIWDWKSSKPFCNIEPPVSINHVEPVGSTGLIFMANEGVPMHTYFIPQLGPAPRWCSFLDNLTEELADDPSSNAMHDNLRFVTRAELEKLGLDNVIGTASVRAYMHGYFIDQQLYEEARLIANPFAYEEYRQKKIQEKIEKERESRIRTSKAEKVKLNKSLAKRLEEKTRKGKEFDAFDPRFKKVFEDSEFAVDENNVEYLQLNPTRSKTKS